MLALWPAELKLAEHLRHLLKMREADANLAVECELAWRAHLLGNRRSEILASLLVDRDHPVEDIQALFDGTEAVCPERPLRCRNRPVDICRRPKRDLREYLLGRWVDNVKNLGRDGIYPVASI